MNRRVAPWLAALLISACASNGPAIIDENSHVYPPPVGAVIVLHRDITVPADRARVTLQRGGIAPGVHPFDIWCQLEVNDVMPVPQTVHADTFTVRKVSSEVTHVVVNQNATLVAESRGGSGPSDETHIWHLWLSSAQQPNVRRLSCGGVFQQPWQARYPSIIEIRGTLGEIASLNLPATTSPSP
jgi:hypothetical protein